jgi:gliding motility-associated-like protein
LYNCAGDTIVCVNTPLAHQGLFLVPDTAVVHWQWNFPNGAGSTVQNPPAQLYNVPGDYTVLSIATDAEGCADTTRRNLHVKPLPTVTMPGQMTIQAGFPVTIPAQYTSNTNAWIWSPATGLSCFQCPNPDAGPKFNTYYEVFFRDVFGCTNKGNITVSVICKNANLFIPNTFSPNGDGNNDVFYPRGKGLERVKILRIFNRWGEVVFESKDFPVNNALYGWNGTYKGRKPEADVYVYQAEVYCDNGEIIKLNGNISLLR